MTNIPSDIDPVVTHLQLIGVRRVIEEVTHRCTREITSHQDVIHASFYAKGRYDMATDILRILGVRS